MYKPKYIKIQNIGTFSDITYDFKAGKSQIIQGKNLDDKGQKSNGVGKSFFIDAIAFAITGLVLSGRTLEELINDKEESAYIELLLINNSDEFLIKRYLSRKKPQLIEIFKNGISKHANESDVNQRNQFIIDEIGISKEDLFKFFLISKDRYKPYFKLSDTEKKEITSRFSNADKIDEVFPKLQRDITQEEITESNLNSELTSLISQKESYEKVIVDFEAQNDEQVKEQLKREYQNNIDQLFDIIKEKKEQITYNETVLLTELSKTLSSLSGEETIIEESITKLEADVEKLQEEKKSAEDEIELEINKINAEVDLKESELNKLRVQITENNTLKNEVELLISKTNSELKSSIECPSCGFEFIIDSKRTVDEIKSILVELEDTLKTINEELLVLREKYDSKNAEILDCRERIKTIKQSVLLKTRAISELITDLNRELLTNQQRRKSNTKEQQNTENEINSISTKNKLLENDIELSESKIKGFEIKIREVDDNDNTELLQKYKSLITDLDRNIFEKEEELKKQKEIIQNLNSWILKFKSFKSYLANLSLKNIEDLINSFLQKMNTDLSVEIEGYKQKGKKITEKITESVLRNGFRVGSYSRFSGGERGRIDIGSILANQTLINNNASPRGLDLILIDEVLESLDSTGIEGIIKSMDNIDKTMLLITQNEINSLPEQTLTFIKKNGITKTQTSF